MKGTILVLTSVGASLTFAAIAFAAGPPPGVPHGPPPFVTLGPPPGVGHGPPPGVGGGPPPGVGPASTGQGLAANELGKLNAAHASPVALEHAAPGSTVGIIATYQAQMNDALDLMNPMDQEAAIIAAREQLAAASNKQLTPDAVSRIDEMLGIMGADPTLGTTP